MGSIEEITALIRRQRVAFIASIDKKGFPNQKAMLRPRKRNDLKEFYFQTSLSSMRVTQYRDNPRASIYFYHKGIIKYEGIMLTGTMEILEDAIIKRELWHNGDIRFYPDGVSSTDYCILKFTAQEGRYYCNMKSESFSIS